MHKKGTHRGVYRVTKRNKQTHKRTSKCTRKEAKRGLHEAVKMLCFFGAYKIGVANDNFKKSFLIRYNRKRHVNISV